MQVATLQSFHTSANTPAAAIKRTIRSKQLIFPGQEQGATNAKLGQNLLKSKIAIKTLQPRCNLPTCVKDGCECACFMKRMSCKVSTDKYKLNWRYFGDNILAVAFGE